MISGKSGSTTWFVCLDEMRVKTIMMFFPRFYDPDKVGKLYVPDTAGVIAEAQQANLPPARTDSRRVILLLVDPQVDFIHTDGSLSVPGAVDDTRCTIQWLLNNAARVSAVTASLDSHIPTQIFYPTWWINEAGEHPVPFTTITSASLAQGQWKPVFETTWSVDYVHKLESQAKKELMIWPYHTMIGTPGHAISPALYEAIAYHAAARESQPVFLTKGAIPKTEHYSLLEPEVKVSNQSQGTLNTSFLKMLESYDAVYVAGQAKSHCVLETIASVVRYYQTRPDLIARWHVLVDCTSSVAHPEIDFDTLADEALAGYEKQGLKLVSAADPIG
ncbi:MAG: cysteine hydrolase family protein [Anaerolineae bacterium]|nr:cysteine hydrolase family protein [Anaerolineae bacterium]